jgi:cystathionine beta-synthase
LKQKDPETPDLVVVAADQSVRDALGLITGHDVSQLPVVREGAPVGSVAEDTLMARILEDPAILDEPVTALMGDPFPEVDRGAGLEDVARLLTRASPAVLVRHDGALRGIITRYDMVRQLTG